MPVTRSRRSVLKLGAVVGLGLTVPVALTRDALAIRDRDCSDFRTQRQAQRFYRKNGGPRQDPHGLDRDRDGIACEELR